ncbi:hypothetical protein [Mangrovibacterium marinum]|uniref:Lipoprotein n=1 Tax=Mangrovibacterium marinum TaxID=1639118 RepID=A0A2T5BZH3_9BACT|nr:hypothetical protein [Mangrovibacterium marinum]PTN07687.1 hypothetical protein C8N47_11430 [Mangrovibacterium marinum]
MKRRLKYWWHLLLLVVLLPGCAKTDEDVGRPENFLQVQDRVYELNYGYLEDWGRGDYYQGDNVDLVLVSEGISINFDNYDVSGSGHILYLELFTDRKAGVARGKYRYSNAEPYQTGTFDDGEYLVNFDIVTEEAQSVGYFKSGVVTVKRRGAVYEITIHGTDLAGRKITGFYKGRLKLLDVESFFQMSTEELDRDRFQILPDVY